MPPSSHPPSSHPPLLCAQPRAAAAREVREETGMAVGEAREVGYEWLENMALQEMGLQ